MPFPQSLYCIWLKYCNKCKFHTAAKNWNNLYEKIRQNQNISCLVRTHFPAFYVSYMLLLWVLINSLYFLCSSWLARVIPLVWFYDTQLKATLNWINGGSNMDSCGGGGGSYNTGTNQQNDCCFNTAGHGQVTITLLQKNWATFSNTIYW